MTRIRRAMVLAAGLGTRLRPLTDRLPKPLVTVAGETLIDRILDRLAEAGVEEVVVNLHHMADQLSGHLARRSGPRIIESREEALLETGGGVRRALPLLGTIPSSWSTATSCGATAGARHWNAWQPPGTTGGWTRCCCCSGPSRPSAMTAMATSC